MTIYQAKEAAARLCSQAAFFFESSVDWLPATTPLVILGSAIVAIISVSMARRTARQSETIGLIERSESSDYYRKAHTTFKNYRMNKSFNELHNPSDEKTKGDRDKILDYLNHYELISIGILNNILDEEIYRSWMRGPFVRDWNAAADFIQRERYKRYKETEKWKYHSDLFENYQKVACRWSRKAVNLNPTTAGPPTNVELGVGDEPLPPSRREET